MSGCLLAGSAGKDICHQVLISIPGWNPHGRKEVSCDSSPPTQKTNGALKKLRHRERQFCNEVEKLRAKIRVFVIEDGELKVIKLMSWAVYSFSQNSVPQSTGIMYCSTSHSLGKS